MCLFIRWYCWVVSSFIYSFLCCYIYALSVIPRPFCYFFQCWGSSSFAHEIVLSFYVSLLLQVYLLICLFTRLLGFHYLTALRFFFCCFFLRSFPILKWLFMYMFLFLVFLRSLALASLLIVCVFWSFLRFLWFCFSSVDIFACVIALPYVRLCVCVFWPFH